VVPLLRLDLNYDPASACIRQIAVTCFRFVRFMLIYCHGDATD